MEIIVENLDITDLSELIITAQIVDSPLNMPLHYHTMGFHLTIRDDVLNAAIYPYNGGLKFYFPDPENYVYLPDEDMIIPKILAGSIPKDRKKKATREVCFTTVEGTFLPLPYHTDAFCYDEKRYKKSFRSKRDYIMADIKNISLDWLTPYLEGYILESLNQ